MKFPGYVSLRLEEDLRKKIEELAQAEDRSIGYIVRMILREGFAAREKKGKKRAP
jgi:predicted transcriptional regulator